jgi:peroxiredoxin (alkyl hydroperoxide reductase subunit C)
MSDSLIGKPAPDFTAAAVMGDGSIVETFNLADYFKGHYGIVFFYPLDFTFVCPSEIIAFDRRLKAFEKRGARVVGVSVDSHFSHFAWRNTPVAKGGIGPVGFPLIADLTKGIAKSFGVLHGESVALRGTFLTDQSRIVRHATINDLPLGRNVDETLRTLDALIFHEEHGEVCPAGWTEGKSGMKASPDGVADYLEEHAAAL